MNQEFKSSDACSSLLLHLSGCMVFMFILRDNIHSHLHHAKQPMAVRGWGLSDGRFPWKKWGFCSEIKKIVSSCRNERQFAYKLYQNLYSCINALSPNVNVIIKYQHNR